VNAGLIFLLAPPFAALWSWLGRRGRDPAQPVKIALGLFFLGLGYVFMVWAGRIALDPSLKAPMILVLATYFWHTVGELCLSPTGLAYVTRTAPVRYVSALMGVWFVSNFLANLGGGVVAAQVEAIERGEIALPWHLGGQADFFLLFVVSSGAAAALILALAPMLARWAPRRA
jgi:POT family proton-dependent oligopeptide transporter